MNNILEKVGLSDFFAYICPGSVLLASVTLWINPKEVEKFLLGGDSFVLIAFMFIFSYTLGLIVASWSNRGADRYVRIIEKGDLLPGKKRKISRIFLLVFHGLPRPRVEHSSRVEANLRISEYIQKCSGLRGLSLTEAPWDKLVLCRTLMADQVGEGSRSILVEADSSHRRFLFAQGVAMAFFLLFFQSLARLLLLIPCLTPWTTFLPPIHPFSLIVIALLGIAASIGLRIAAGCLWEYEFVLTSSLTRVE